MPESIDIKWLDQRWPCRAASLAEGKEAIGPVATLVTLVFIVPLANPELSALADPATTTLKID
jgi:hypothetical protein